jgi:hypothetical protein
MAKVLNPNLSGVIPCSDRTPQGDDPKAVFPGFRDVRLLSVAAGAVLPAFPVKWVT